MTILFLLVCILLNSLLQSLALRSRTVWVWAHSNGQLPEPFPISYSRKLVSFSSVLSENGTISGSTDQRWRVIRFNSLGLRARSGSLLCTHSMPFAPTYCRNIPPSPIRPSPLPSVPPSRPSLPSSLQF